MTPGELHTTSSAWFSTTFNKENRDPLKQARSSDRVAGIAYRDRSSAPMGALQPLLPEGSAKKHLPRWDHRWVPKARRQQARSHPARARLLPVEPQARQRAEQTRLPLPRPPAKHQTKHLEAPGGEDRAETQPAEAQTAGQLSKRCVSTERSSKGAAGAKAGSAAPVALAGPPADITLLPAAGRAPSPAVPRERGAHVAPSCVSRSVLRRETTLPCPP